METSLHLVASVFLSFWLLGRVGRHPQSRGQGTHACEGQPLVNAQQRRNIVGGKQTSAQHCAGGQGGVHRYDLISQQPSEVLGLCRHLTNEKMEA